MSELLTAFSLGNSAILTNTCLLPLYPGLIAFLAGNIDQERTRHATGWLGLLVLAGVLSMMLIIGLMLYLLKAPFSNLLPVFLPSIYLIVIVLGLIMLLGYNPFSRLGSMQLPVVNNPYARAYVYGLLLAPMTLPCTGPIVTTIFVLGVANATALVDGLLYFLAFGLGFGWPLIVLPLVARSIQRQFLGWITRYHSILNRVAGLLLIVVGLIGIMTDYLPNLR